MCVGVTSGEQTDVAELIRRATRITKDGASERKARRKLVEMGEQVVPAVIEWLELEEARGGTTGRWNSYAYMVDMLSQIGTPKAREFLTPERAHGSLLGSQECRAVLLKRIEIWQSEDRFERLIEMLDGSHEDCKWAVFKLSVLGDVRAIGPLDRIAAEGKGVDIRETAKEALAHLRDPNVPVRYIDHLPSQGIELTVPVEGYRLGEPVAVRCKITGGPYGSRSLVQFSKPDWQFLPWGLSPPNPDRRQPFSLKMYRKRGRRYDRVNAIRQLRPADQSMIGKDGEPASLYVDAADFGAISRFDLKPGESRLYEFADIGQAFPMTEPGEYRIHVSSYGLALSDFVNIHIRPAATDPSSSP